MILIHDLDRLYVTLFAEKDESRCNCIDPCSLSIFVVMMLCCTNGPIFSTGI